MVEMISARATVASLLMGVQDVEESVLRGEKRHDGKCYAVAYVDFADDVVGRADNLREFQERVLGGDFFDAPEDLRWNKYLYIVAGPNSIGQVGFAAAKSEIESDRDYARKRVVFESELESLLGSSQHFLPEAKKQGRDVVAEWNERLSAVGLDELLDKPTPRTEVIERISSATTKRIAVQDKTKVLSATDMQLTNAWLSQISIEKFRAIHDGKSYDFGTVTLIVGSNGTGKTSLLEAIEFLYCGHNRRPNSSIVQRVQAKFKSLTSSAIFGISSTTDTARIKSRSLAWYNRDERAAKSILDGFSRYNFLDTDAAFRISTELEPNEISEDLSRLLVGADAALTWDYLQKIVVDIENAHDKAELSLDRYNMQLQSEEVELKRLLERPSIAKALIENFWSAMSEIGWKTPAKISAEVILSEREPIEKAMASLQILKAVGPESITLRLINEREVSLAFAVNAAKVIEENRLKLLHSQVRNKELIQSKDKVVQMLDRWLTYTTYKFSAIRLNNAKSKLAVEQALSELGAYASGEIPEIPEQYLAIPVDKAIDIANELVRQSESQLATLNELANSYGRIASARALAARHLQEAALESFRNGHPKDNCPVCRTSHNPNDLAELIEGITGILNEPEELTKLSESIERANKNASNAKATLGNLEQVQSIALSISVDYDLPASQILEHLKRLRIELERLRIAAAVSISDWNVALDFGLNIDEYELLWNQLSPILGMDQAALEEKNVISIRDEYTSSILEIREKQESLRLEIELKTQEIAGILETQISRDWKSQVKQKEGFQFLNAMFEEFQHIKERALLLMNVIDLNEDSNLGLLHIQLAGASKALSDAIIAIQNESKGTKEISDATSLLELTRNLVEKFSTRERNLQNALKSLQELISTSSLERATKMSLEAIGAQINDIFSRIHSPSEYKYVGSDEVLLRSSNNDERRTLEQVSTGQRAAFALSIFLALNSTSKGAPPVLLIDDPIAHIDDLNALSFLDYLRDLAANSKRQIFFATADTRIASLFAKKFSFLGDEFKTITLSRESDEPYVAAS